MTSAKFDYDDVMRAVKKMFRRTKAEKALLRSFTRAVQLPFILGSVSAVYRKCGSKRCRCAHGHPHGPYYQFCYYERGKLKRQMILKGQLQVFQSMLARGRQLLASLKRLAELQRQRGAPMLSREA